MSVTDVDDQTRLTTTDDGRNQSSMLFLVLHEDVNAFVRWIQRPRVSPEDDGGPI